MSKIKLLVLLEYFTLPLKEVSDRLSKFFQLNLNLISFRVNVVKV